MIELEFPIHNIKSASLLLKDVCISPLKWHSNHYHDPSLFHKVHLLFLCLLKILC